MSTEIEVKFLRHAEAEHMKNSDLIAGRSIDAKLTNRGIQDSMHKGIDLSFTDYRPDVVYSSSALRCMQTADAILKHAGLYIPIIKTDDLLEMDHGNFVGKVRSEIYTPEIKEQIFILGKDFALPGGESMNQVGERGVNWLAKQAKLHSDIGRVSILATTHAGTITHTVGRLLEWDHQESLERLKSMDTLAETDLFFDGNVWIVNSFANKPIEIIVH